MSWLLDAVPWWVWALAVALAAAGSYPMWIALWAVLPAKARVALVAAGGVVLAYIAGRQHGRKTEQDKAAEQDARVERKRAEVDHEVRNMGPDDRDRALREWMRDGK